MAELTEEQECPVYGCTLLPDEHGEVEPGSADCEPDSLWHADGEGGHWPAPLVSAPYSPGPEDRRIYTVYEEREQLESRDRGLRWVRQHWQASVEDTLFEHTMLGVREIIFDGDLRPSAKADS